MASMSTCFVGVQPQEAGAEQRPAGQVEGRGAFVVQRRRTSCARGRSARRSGRAAAAPPARRGDQLAGRAIDGGEAGAQRLVPADDLVEARSSTAASIDPVSRNAPKIL